MNFIYNFIEGQFTHILSCLRIRKQQSHSVGKLCAHEVSTLWFSGDKNGKLKF